MTALTSEQINDQLSSMSEWRLTHDGRRIRRDFNVDNFLSGLDFFSRVSVIAEEMQHHPDLHLENYKDAWIEIWTHTVNGLTDLDFQLAAKIDELS